MPVHPKTQDLVGDWEFDPAVTGGYEWKWPCPGCKHGKETHCHPYTPMQFSDANGKNHGEHHSRCSADVPVLELIRDKEGRVELDKNGNPTGRTKQTGTRLCGTCRVIF